MIRLFASPLIIELLVLPVTLILASLVLLVGSLFGQDAADESARVMMLNENELDQMLTGQFMVCSIFGATAGALIKVCLLPPKISGAVSIQVRQMAMEFVAAQASGLVLMPLAFRFTDVMPVHPVSAITFTAITAICSTMIIHAIFSYVQSRLPKDENGPSE